MVDVVISILPGKKLIVTDSYVDDWGPDNRELHSTKIAPPIRLDDCHGEAQGRLATFIP
jgi:hypothetical protein